MEQATRRILPTGDYTRNAPPKSASLKDALIAGIEAGPLDADALLAGCCRGRYEKERIYKAVARRTKLDWRTLKSRLQPAGSAAVWHPFPRSIPALLKLSPP
jgi:hypothetical protein